MNDALLGIMDVEVPDAVGTGDDAEGLDQHLPAVDGVVSTAALGRDQVIGGCVGQLGVAHRPSSHAQAFEGLGTRVCGQILFGNHKADWLPSNRSGGVMCVLAIAVGVPGKRHPYRSPTDMRMCRPFSVT
jgi:hypothetical protein